MFGDEKALEKAKRSGKAFLCVAGGKSLPSPFHLTGDSRWDTGGDLYEAYDLQLDDGSGHEKEAVADKVLSKKTNNDIKKIMKMFQENQENRDLEESLGDELFNEFSEILSTEGKYSANPFFFKLTPKSLGHSKNNRVYKRV